MDLKGMNRYRTYGFRKSWLEHFFEYGTDCFSRGELGSSQYDSLRAWLKDAELLSSDTDAGGAEIPTELSEKLKQIGAYNPLTWAAIWANLAYNSSLVRWYMLMVSPNAVYGREELVLMLGDDYAHRTRVNGIQALFETLRHSPIGSALKQGIPIGSGNSYKYAKERYESPDPRAILYALYLFAEKTGRYSFSLSQLAEMRGKFDSAGVDPVSIFGFDSASFKEILQEISLYYDKYIRTSFVADLDMVGLAPEISSLDIVDLFQE
jgi:phosphoadenosine phosphosulfate reductase